MNNVIQQSKPIPASEPALYRNTDIYFDITKDKVNKYPYPTNRRDDKLQYCNQLPPPPRDQLLNVPYEGADCPFYPTNNKDTCYFIDNKYQGVPGIACNFSGGSDNANFVRGNQFADAYNKDKLISTPLKKVVQLPLEKENPLIIYDKSNFYPYKNEFIDYQGPSYPIFNSFTKSGMPTYHALEQFDNNMSDNNILITTFIIIILAFIFHRFR